MLNFSSAAPNKDMERDGIWRTWSNGVHSIDFLLSRAGGSNAEFRIRAEALTRTYRRSGVDLLQLPAEVQDEINRELYADTVVRGWKSDAFDGLNESNFSKAHVKQLFEEVPDTLNFCVVEATSSNNYLNSALVREAGNSSPS